MWKTCGLLVQTAVKHQTQHEEESGFSIKPACSLPAWTDRTEHCWPPLWHFVVNTPQQTCKDFLMYIHNHPQQPPHSTCPTFYNCSSGPRQGGRVVFILKYPQISRRPILKTHNFECLFKTNKLFLLLRHPLCLRGFYRQIQWANEKLPNNRKQPWAVF